MNQAKLNAKKIRLLRERLGLDLRQAKEALVICLEGVNLHEFQGQLADQLGVDTEHVGDADSDVAGG